MSWCWGRECKPGWGYNASSGQIIPVQGEPPKAKSKNLIYWSYFVHSLSSTDNEFPVSFVFLY